MFSTQGGAPGASGRTKYDIIVEEGITALLSILDDKQKHRFMREFAAGLGRRAARRNVERLHSASTDRADAEGAIAALEWFKENSARFIGMAGE